MKTLLILLGLTSVSLAAPAVTVKGLLTTSGETLTLDLVADTHPNLELRSFGLKVNFNKEAFKVSSVGRYDSLWFLSPDGGLTKHDYAEPEPEVSTPGGVEILGARFDGLAPEEGINGQQVLLSTIQFQRVGEGSPKFSLALARPESFVNFSLADGTPVDHAVAGLGREMIMIEMKPPVDSDGDGLPDSYELDKFGSLNKADANSDSDGDGSSDLEEWTAGTDPLDAESSLKLKMTMQTDGSKVFEWTGMPGRVYSLMKSHDLGGFHPMLGAMPGAGDHEMIEPADGSSKGFYRLKVERAAGQ